MFNFKEALTYIFNEKDWKYKFLLPFLLQLLIVLPSMTLSLMQQQPAATLYNANSYGMFNMMSSRYTYSSGYLGLFVSCIMLFSFIPYLIVNLWYVYENTQAGIFKRETKAIWKNDFTDTLKKSTKYFLNSLAYGLIVTLAAVVIGGIICVIIFALVILGIAVFQNTTTTSFQNLSGVLLASGVGIILICVVAAVLLVLYAFVYMWMMTGALRLTATNSFSEGLKFKENWEIAMRHKSKFLAILLIIFVTTFIFGFFYGVLEVLAEFLAFGSTLLDFIYRLTFEILLALATTYGVYFVYPRLLGQIFRRIISEESSLKFIKL